jgi:arylsulfatase
LVAERLEAVKWRNWKLAFYEETRDWLGTPQKLTLPKLFNLATDPKEEYPDNAAHTWEMDRCLKVIKEFQEILKRYPAIPESARAADGCLKPRLFGAVEGMIGNHPSRECCR